MAKALVRRGVVKSVSEAFQRYIGDQGPAFVPRSRLSPERAIEIIHEAGGVAVFAHPVLTQKDHLIPELARKGLDGLEVYCCHHSPAAVARYQTLARECGLLESGGSDFHGEGDNHAPLGAAAAPMRAVEQLREAAQRRR